MPRAASNREHPSSRRRAWNCSLHRPARGDVPARDRACLPSTPRQADEGKLRASALAASSSAAVPPDVRGPFLPSWAQISGRDKAGERFAETPNGTTRARYSAQNPPCFGQTRTVRPGIASRARAHRAHALRRQCPYPPRDEALERARAQRWHFRALPTVGRLVTATRRARAAKSRSRRRHRGRRGGDLVPHLMKSRAYVFRRARARAARLSNPSAPSPDRNHRPRHPDRSERRSRPAEARDPPRRGAGLRALPPHHRSADAPATRRGARRADHAPTNSGGHLLTVAIATARLVGPARRSLREAFERGNSYISPTASCPCCPRHLDDLCSLKPRGPPRARRAHNHRAGWQKCAATRSIG